MSEARYTFTDGVPEAVEPISVAATPEIVPEPVAPAPDTPPIHAPELTPEEQAEEAEAQKILEEEEAKHKGKSGSAKLKERLEREREEAQRLREERDRLREQIAAQKPPTPTPTAPPAIGIPTLDQFLGSFPNASLDDYEAFKIQFAVQRAKAEITQQLQAEKVKTQWEQKASKIPDFDTVQAVQAVKEAAGTSYGAAVWDSIEESDQGPELLDHLRKHPEEARRIAGLNERQAVKELGRLEERLASKATPKPKPSPAPPPIPPLQAASPVPQIDEKKKRYVEY